MHLILLETSGNQSYIFATNKLRENVGASELIYRAGTQWVLEAVEKAGGPSLWVEDTRKLRDNLREDSLNPPIEDNRFPVEIILAASGKAVLLVKDQEIGKQIIQTVTTDALLKAPGFDLCGVISRDFNLADSAEKNGKQVPLISVIYAELEDQLDDARLRRPGAAMRFFRLPCVQECFTSGLPAAVWDKEDLNDERQRREPLQARSAVSLKKRGHYQIYRERMAKTFNHVDFAYNITELEEKCEWLAVVHADGNGLGKIFLNFAEKLEPATPRDYIKELRNFSLSLDECTERAFSYAMEELPAYRRKRSLRSAIVPIVLGGDDMTVVCDGAAALDFTYQFLTRFEEETQKNRTTNRVAEKILKAPNLSACAGIAIVGPHYPFSSAYDLAEDLIVSAKTIKEKVRHATQASQSWPCSALDFHLLYDASGKDLKPIRQKLIYEDAGKQVQLFGRPYVVTPARKLAGAAADGQRWAAQRAWEDLNKKVEIILRKDAEGRRLLPNSQLHDLREGLFLKNQAATNARFQLMRQRYAVQGINHLAGESEETLFTQAEGELNLYFTRLLDAMDVASLRGDTYE